MAGRGAVIVRSTTSTLVRYSTAAVEFGAADFTVVCWYKPSADGLHAGTNDAVVVKDFGTTGWFLGWIGGTGYYGFAIRGFGAFVSATTYGTPSTGAWAMLAGVHDQAGSQIKTSINGGAFDTSARATAPAAASGLLYVGGGDSVAGLTDGAVTRLGVWSRKLTTVELTQLYNSGNGLRHQDLDAGLLSGLVEYYDLDDASGARYSTVTGVWLAENPAATAAIGSAAFPGTGLSDLAVSKNIVFDGDSLTYGYSTSDGGGVGIPPAYPGRSYPGRLTGYYGELPYGFQTTNLGVSGATAQAVIDSHVSTADGLYSAAYGKNIYVLWIGFNDYFTAASTAAQLKTKIQSIVSGRQAAGYKVLILTWTPSNFSGQPAGFSTYRSTINSWILAGSSGADAVCDSGSNALLADPDDAAYYVDALHLTPLGYDVVARDVAVSLDLLLAASAAVPYRTLMGVGV